MRLRFELVSIVLRVSRADHWITKQCDQIGRFLKFWVKYFVSKVAQVYSDISYFEKHPFSDTKCFGNILGNFWKFSGYF